MKKSTEINSNENDNDSCASSYASDEPLDADNSKKHDVGAYESTTRDTSSTKADDDAEDEREKFSQKETKNVFCLRVLVIIVLFLAAVGVSLVVFLATKGAETEEFENQYEATSNKVLDTFQALVTQKLDAVASLAVAVTAHAVDNDNDSNCKWQ